MFANVAIIRRSGRSHRGARGAVIETGRPQGGAGIAKEAGYFEPRDIVTGARADGYYEVIEGLRPGETVVTSANFLIDSESKLKEAIGGGAVISIEVRWLHEARRPVLCNGHVGFKWVALMKT
jgi:membrane fusion protein, copper/silver efflux system